MILCPFVSVMPLLRQLRRKTARITRRTGVFVTDSPGHRYAGVLSLRSSYDAGLHNMAEQFTPQALNLYTLLLAWFIGASTRM